jgi:hypothetical protein
MDDDTVDQTGLPHHKNAWTQHELLASILASYVNVIGEHGGRWPSWTVASDDKDIHAVVNDVNAHLFRLGWMAKLTKDDDWVLTVFPTPERQFPRLNTTMMFWFLSLLTLTLAGDLWMSPNRSTTGWFHSSSLVDAFLGYTLPILLTLYVASLVQRSVASRYGVRSGHLLPVPDFTIALYALGMFPASWLFWPFGILLIPTLPRMDARPWPNRASLGFTALTVPIVLGLFGSVLFLLGLSMTPEYLPSSLMPLVSAPPLFLSLLATEVAGDDAWVRLLWAHPWVHAGGMLMLFAWISILPIPTFPGGRILIARMGMIEARSSSTQSLIFVTMLFCAYVFGVFEDFSLWFLVFALLLPLLFFFGNDVRIPLLLDETTGLNEDEHKRMGLLLLIVFVLLLPASQPVVHDTHWNDPMTYDLLQPELAVLLEDGTWNSRTVVKVTNPSSLERQFAVHALFEHQGHAWTVEWDCDGEDMFSIDGEGCGTSLLPQRTATFWLNLTWAASHEPTQAKGSYVMHINDGYDVVPFTVQPSLEIVPAEQWYDVPDGSNVLRCVDVYGALLSSDSMLVTVDESTLLGVQTSLVHIDGHQGLTANFSEVPERLCLSGLDPLVFQPSMASIHINNDSFSPLLPERRPLVAYVPEDGWTLRKDSTQQWGSLLQEGGVLMANAEHCPINASISTPPRPLEGEWIWDTSVFASGHLPLIESGQNMTLLIAEDSNMSVCTDAFTPYPQFAFHVKRGPELLVTWMNATTRFWTTPWAIAANGTLLNEGMGDLTFHNPSERDISFRLAREGSPGDDWQHDWNGTHLAPGNTTLQLVPPSSPLATMWLSLESGTVVLHLASYQ